MAEKLYYSMGEVSEMFDVKPSLLRYWESQFPVLRPKRNKKGNRLFTPQDVENLKLIYHLVKERGMTLDGARKALRSRRADKGVSRDAELMERLQHIRALLVEVREELKSDAGGLLVDAEEERAGAPEAAMPAAAGRDNAPRPAGPASATVAGVAGPAPEPDATPGAAPGIPAAEPLPEPGAPRRTTRKARRKKEESENKELFAFYEQSLF